MSTHPSFPGYDVAPCGCVTSPSGRLLTWTPNDGGYPRVRMRTAQGRWVNVPVHTLVLESFRGARPTKRHHGAHIDGNRSNAHTKNLAWKTKRANERDKRAHNTHTKIVGLRRYTDEARREAAERLARGESRRSIATKLGMTRGAIYRIERSVAS